MSKIHFFFHIYITKKNKNDGQDSNDIQMKPIRHFIVTCLKAYDSPSMLTIS